MQQPVGGQPVRPQGPAADGVEVRFWAALRAAAGVDAQRVPAGSLAEVLAAVAARHAATPRFAHVLAICSVLLDEQPVGARERTEVDVPAGSTVDLLPPFAGGAPSTHRVEHPRNETRSQRVRRWMSPKGEHR